MSDPVIEAPIDCFQSGIRRYWLKCTHCQEKLARVVIRANRTYLLIIILTFVMYIEKAEIICPNCGNSRRFVSAKIDA